MIELKNLIHDKISLKVWMYSGMTLLLVFMGMYVNNRINEEIRNRNRELRFIHLDKIKNIEIQKLRSQNSTLDLLLKKDTINSHKVYNESEVILSEVKSMDFNSSSMQKAFVPNDSGLPYKRGASMAKFEGETLISKTLENIDGNTVSTIQITLDSTKKNPKNDSLIFKFMSSGLSSTQLEIVPLTWILSKIWPELLFATLLFLIIGFGFRTAIRNIEAQKQLAVLKNDFLQNMTHELKTPISTASVAIEAVKNFDVKNNPHKVTEYLNVSASELKRLASIVDKVLSNYKLENNEAFALQEQINLSDKLYSEIDSLTYTAQLNQTLIHTDIQSGVYVKGNHDLLKGIIYNLIDNAIKYNVSSPSKVWVSLRTQGDKAIFIVEDNGIGIADADLPFIFDPFYRVPHGNIHNIKGHGLGLAFVKKALTIIGADIAVQSELHRGTKFTVTFYLS
jgi:signal transduction histidine kinase